jgi:hypothetical protein
MSFITTSAAGDYSGPPARVSGETSLRRPRATAAAVPTGKATARPGPGVSRSVPAAAPGAVPASASAPGRARGAALPRALAPGRATALASPEPPPACASAWGAEPSATGPRVTGRAGRAGSRSARWPPPLPSAGHCTRQDRRRPAAGGAGRRLRASRRPPRNRRSGPARRPPIPPGTARAAPAGYSSRRRMPFLPPVAARPGRSMAIPVYGPPLLTPQNHQNPFGLTIITVPHNPRLWRRAAGMPAAGNGWVNHRGNH